MNYFLDTEFYENGTTVQLISIALVCEDGRELYLENNEFDWSQVPADHWIQDNVKPHLQGTTKVRAARPQIAELVKRFVRAEDQRHDVRIWGYFADYDWVVFCQLFGTMVKLPDGFPMYCLDLKQSMVERGLSGEWKRTTCPDPKDEHNALADARWNHDLFNAIQANAVACPSGVIIP